jgi:hypothetical protein
MRRTKAAQHIERATALLGEVQALCEAGKWEQALQRHADALYSVASVCGLVLAQTHKRELRADMRRAHMRVVR